jgi:hypothetical protein
MSHTARITPAGRTAVITLAAISAVCLGLALVVYLVLKPFAPLIAWLAILPTLAIAALIGWFAVAQAKSSVTIGQSSIDLRLPLYSRSIPLADVVADSVRTVMLEKDDDYRLTWRTNGLSVPGYQLGWFRTANAGAVLAAVTNGANVAWQTRKDFGVIISVEHPDALIAAIRAAPRA